MPTDADIAAAVAHLKQTTTGYLKSNGQPKPAPWPEGSAHWAPALELLEAQAPDPDPQPTPGGVLRYKPPAGWERFERYALQGSGGATFPDTKDLLVDIGDYKYPEGIALVGGRQIVIMGGRITATGSDRSAGVGLAVKGNTDASWYYVEGVRIRPDVDAQGKFRALLHDGLALRGARGRVTFQNMRIGPCAVKEGFDASQGHADVLQVQAGPFEGTLEVDRLTGFTDYSGIMYSEILVRKSSWSHVDLHGFDIDPDEQAWATFYAGNPTSVQGLSLSEFYVSGFGAGSVPASLPITKGVPAGGEFVPESAVALPYRSPGYA